MLQKLIICALIGYATSSILLPDSQFTMRYCLGHLCPTFSLPVLESPELIRNSSTICTENKTYVMSDPADCQVFYECNNQTGIRLTCTLGYAFHPRYNLCVPKTLVKACGSIYCPPSVFVGNFPDKENCRRFYKCAYGVPLHFECEIGYKYDEDLGSCSRYNPEEFDKVACGGSQERLML